MWNLNNLDRMNPLSNSIVIMCLRSAKYNILEEEFEQYKVKDKTNLFKSLWVIFIYPAIVIQWIVKSNIVRM